MENIIEEVKTLHHRYDVKLFVIEDDLFTAHRRRVIKFLKELHCIGIDDIELQFPNGLSINTMNEEIIDAMIDNSLQVFTFAIESGSTYTQKNLIKKNVNLDKAIEIVRLCRSKGKIVRCYFILGFPRETIELMNESIDFMKKLGADWYAIKSATPLIGSEMYAEFLDAGYIQENVDTWTYFTFQKRTFDTIEIGADDLNELIYRTNLIVNFTENINIKEKNLEKALSIFDDILNSYPYHIFAMYGKYLSFEIVGDSEKKVKIENGIIEMVHKDLRAKHLFDRYGDLMPEIDPY